eukprot:s2423_g21.t1
MRFVVAFAALALLVALPRVTLGSSQNGIANRCPCLENHSSEFAVYKLESNASCPKRFGLDCKEHKISGACAVHLFETETAAQLECGSSISGESPRCNTKWCYVDKKKCSMNFALGVLGEAYSYATCGNLRHESDKYLKTSLAALLRNDSLRVLHVESSLVGGYLGNTECTDHYDAAYPHKKCKGVTAELWARALDELNKSQVKIDHTVIRRGEKGIDQYFIGSNITNQFEEYKQRLKLSGWPTTNYDLCAFATGMGYVDLCTGVFSLTHRRQAMTFMIELYTSPVFMVSKSKCDFFASESGEKFWVWWFHVFSPEAWGFFLGVVFLFIVAMKCSDQYCINQQAGPSTSGQGRTDSGAGPRAVEAQTSMDKFRKCFWCFTHGLADALFGVFEALAFQSKASHRRDSKRPSRSRPSHMLRLGLGFFIWLSMAVYGAFITAEMVSAREAKGEVPSLEEAKRQKIPLCTHLVLQEPLAPYKVVNLTTYSDDWKDVLENLESGNCSAALLDEESWNTFRNRKRLCGFYKEPTADFYVPAGAVVSRRAYRTLEAFRFSPSETDTDFGKSSVLPNLCSNSSADAVCPAIKKGGVPWYTLFSLFLVAAVCGLFSLCGIAHHRNGGLDEENDEEREKERKKEEMYANLKRLLDIEEMKMANIQHSDQAEGAGPPSQDAAEESQDLEASQDPTGATSSTHPNPTILQYQSQLRRDESRRQTRGSKEVFEYAQGSADFPYF